MNYTPIDDLIQEVALTEIAQVLAKYNLSLGYDVALTLKAKK